MDVKFLPFVKLRSSMPVPRDSMESSPNLFPPRWTSGDPDTSVPFPPRVLLCRVIREFPLRSTRLFRSGKEENPATLAGLLRLPSSSWTLPPLMLDMLADVPSMRACWPFPRGARPLSCAS
eukprot:453416-Rhodomonas_salina.1